MKNVIIWGLDKEITRNAFLYLKEQQVIDIKAWFGDYGSPFVTHYNIDYLLGNNINHADIVKCESEIYDIVYKNIYEFLDRISRAFYYRYKPIHEALHLFNILINYFYKLLKTNQIDWIIFDDVPHDAPNYVLYCLAKALNIKTVIVAQSLFPDKFFFCYDINDFGRFENVENLSSNKIPTDIPQEYQKELFYMEKEPFYLKARNSIAKIIKFSDWQKNRFTVWRRSQRKYNGTFDMLLHRITKGLIEYGNNRDFTLGQKLVLQKNVDLSAKYVYFPLHLQPEMTTSALGGIYCDQLLAIERLSSWLPDDWQIYVKENPKQNSRMRGRNFYKRFELIPKAKLIGSDFNTYELIKHARLVATITGTAGWEAISGGKNAVVFGKAWYQTLPGCFIYSEDLSLTEILTYQINHEELEEKLSLLLNKTAHGLINPDYMPLLPSYDQAANEQKVFNFFCNIFN